MPALAALQIDVDLPASIELQPRRHAIDDHGELRPMRLAGREKAKHPGPILCASPSSVRRPASGRTLLGVIDPRAGPNQLMRVARMFEINGDTIGAIVAYREVILAGEATTSAEAKRRVEDLARRAWPCAGFQRSSRPC